MRLYIKNMVCARCKLVVGNELQKLGLRVINMQLGEVEVEDADLTEDTLAKTRQALGSLGFELLDDKRSRLIEQVKAFVIRHVHQPDSSIVLKFSEVIARELQHSYSYLSALFSGVEGMTLEQYIIQQKIERVKELLTYDEQSLSQIAVDLGYSSTAHLSNQFRKMTGMTPTAFRKTGAASRRGLDEIGAVK